MKNVKSIAMAAVLALGAGFAGTALSQGAPITGTAAVQYLTFVQPGSEPSGAGLLAVGAGQEVGIDVSINLTGVTGANCAGATVPAILGGYQIAMEFDTTRLTYIGVQSSPTSGNSNCPTGRPDEYSLPTATNATDANTTGTALFVAQNGASQTDPTGGPRCYFRIRLAGKASNTKPNVNSPVRFRTNARGAYTLSSAVLNCSPNPNVGPVDLPKSADITITLVTTPVELTKFQAE